MADGEGFESPQKVAKSCFAVRLLCWDTGIITDDSRNATKNAPFIDPFGTPFRRIRKRQTIRTMKPIDIPLTAIRVLLARAREKEGWEQLRASMRDEGLKQPIQVRDLGRADEKGIRYELICGEGRVAAAKSLRWETIRALVVDAAPAEIAGRFLAENMIRKSLPWATKGRMIREEVNRGIPIPQIAKSLHISPTLATKYLRVVSKIAQDVDADSLPVNDAEVLCTVPARGQRIVMQIAADLKQPIRDVARAVKKAVADGAGWTKLELEKALAAKEDDLAKLRNKLKVLRLHRALGPGNLEKLLEIPRFKAALKKEGVNV